MKYLIIIGDGMADNPVPDLGGKTPLEAASIPTMDALAQKGELGSVLTVPAGVAPGSDTAILSIFGYDPREYYSGRSPLEAAGSGVKLEAGDVSYRCNMVTLQDGPMRYEQKRILSHSGGSIEGQDSIVLMESLLTDPRFAALAAANGMSFYPSPSFRHIAVQKDADITGLCAAPPHDHLGAAAGDHLPTGCRAAEGLRDMMYLAHTILDTHPINQKRRAAGKMPANGIWFWAEGTAIALPSFYQKHGKKGLVVSAVPLVRGIGALAGFDFAEVPGATGELDTNYEGKADAALDALADEYDIVVVHVEAPDECTHNGDTPGKLQAIEWLDSRCIARLLSVLDAKEETYRLLVLSDHKTLTATRGHDSDPVPYILYDSRTGAGGQWNPSPTVAGDTSRCYTESTASKGPFINQGHALIGRLLEEK